MTGPGDDLFAAAAIEQALGTYQQLRERDRSVILQARKILAQHIYGLVDKGESDERRLILSGLARLTSIERDHAIKSAHDVPAAPTNKRRRAPA